MWDVWVAVPQCPGGSGTPCRPVGEETEENACNEEPHRTHARTHQPRSKSQPLLQKRILFEACTNTAATYVVQVGVETHAATPRGQKPDLQRRKGGRRRERETGGRTLDLQSRTGGREAIETGGWKLACRGEQEAEWRQRQAVGSWTGKGGEAGEEIESDDSPAAGSWGAAGDRRYMWNRQKTGDERRRQTKLTSGGRLGYSGGSRMSKANAP